MPRPPSPIGIVASGALVRALKTVTDPGTSFTTYARAPSGEMATKWFPAADWTTVSSACAVALVVSTAVPAVALINDPPTVTGEPATSTSARGPGCETVVFESCTCAAGSVRLAWPSASTGPASAIDELVAITLTPSPVRGPSPRPT